MSLANRGMISKQYGSHLDSAVTFFPSTLIFWSHQVHVKQINTAEHLATENKARYMVLIHFKLAFGSLYLHVVSLNCLLQQALNFCIWLSFLITQQLLPLLIPLPPSTFTFFVVKVLYLLYYFLDWWQFNMSLIILIRIVGTFVSCIGFKKSISILFFLSFPSNFSNQFCRTKGTMYIVLKQKCLHSGMAKGFQNKH